ncbi:MAG TPA: DUF1552 domain-containing protein [Hyphomicrobiales bacterium]|nr:DUF1552 domain-containing protein [Hyphomicrobiales bacterium]
MPLLESMFPAFGTLAQAQELKPLRFTGVFIPHGGAPGYWEAKGETGFEYPFIWKPLEHLREKVLLTSGMWSSSAENPPGVTGADHFVASAFLAGVKPKKTTGADVEVSTTLDQILAQHIGQSNLLPSLQLAVEDPGSNSTNCGEGYSCVYTNTISWATPTRPLPMEINPQVVFERMFGSGGSAEERAMRRSQQRSILDSITDDLAKLKVQVATPDRVRLEQYFEDVREIERRLQIAMSKSAAVPSMDVPYGVPESFDEHIKLQFDLLALAFQADITRVGTLLMARDLTGRVYPNSGTDISFHGGSHHAEDAGRIAQYAILNRYHASMVAYFADKLASIQEGEGTLLDNSITLYGSNMGNSNQHLHYDVPMVLIGGAGGKLKGDRHLAFQSKKVPTSNMLLSVLDMFDIQMDSFGDSTGRLPGLV